MHVSLSEWQREYAGPGIFMPLQEDMRKMYQKYKKTRKQKIIKDNKR